MSRVTRESGSFIDFGMLRTLLIEANRRVCDVRNSREYGTRVLPVERHLGIGVISQLCRAYYLREMMILLVQLQDLWNSKTRDGFIDVWRGVRVLYVITHTHKSMPLPPWGENFMVICSYGNEFRCLF